jgi:hypothetical protein
MKSFSFILAKVPGLLRVDRRIWQQLRKENQERSIAAISLINRRFCPDYPADFY